MRKHLSVDMTSLEKHHDRFNIDWIRYFKRDSFIANVAMSIIATEIWIGWLYGDNPNFTTVGIIALCGAAVYFTALLLISHAAGNSAEQSARLAGRRGLFSFAAITPIVIGLLVLHGKLGWEDPFSKTITLMLMGQIICGFFAGGLDLLVPLIRHRFRR